MTFYINAWLNRANPFVSVCDRHSGEELMRLEQEELQKHMANGDLCVDDFCTTASASQQLLVKKLLLLGCCHALSTDISELGQQLKQRYPKVLDFPAQPAAEMAENDALWDVGSYNNHSL
ncbi:MAG: hypothetical protein CSA79_02330 [Thiothrix nivea]|nr:MAG: hypothetical protein CSA79_02330 [Thiothrix nivea]